MDRERLLEDYKNGKLTESGWLDLEKAVEKEEILLEELGDLSSWLEKLNKLDEKAPSQRAEQRFYNWLEEETAADNNIRQIKTNPIWWYAAAAVLIFASGIGLGAWFDKGQKYEEQISRISEELQYMQEMMMFTLLKEGSASDRLKAVSYTRNIDDVSDRIATELLYTLNHDDNVNVRLATVDALAKYASNPNVRKGLIESINIQDSPLVQIALIDIMVALREKKAVEELHKLRNKDQTTPEVKSRTEEVLNILI